MFASEYLNLTGVRKAKGTIEIKRLLKTEQKDREIGD